MFYVTTTVQGTSSRHGRSGKCKFMSPLSGIASYMVVTLSPPLTSSNNSILSNDPT
jgi:hypothetical protein